MDELVEKINYHGNYSNINAALEYNDIDNVQFSQSLSGYDARHVDAFLGKLSRGC